MSLDYWAFDPSSCQFPKPRVSLLPNVFERSETCEAHAQSRLAGGVLHFSRGRYALGEAYRLAGLEQGGALLAPAYHCVTMLDPALALGADVLLYPLNSDLSPNTDKLNEIYAQSTKPIKALLATHFFGFVRDFSWLKKWCDEKGVILIEDCSHALFTEQFQAKGIGQYGQFVASSPYKFFPSADGGCLYAPDAGRFDGASTQAMDWLSELRGIKYCFDRARLTKVDHRDIQGIDQELDIVVSHSPAPGVDQRLQRPAQSLQYSNASSRAASLRSSRWVINHSTITGNVSRRQANYRRWLQELSDVPNSHALYSDLPEHVVPYMFPFYVDTPMPHFYWLKKMGVPVWRWDEMAVSNCQVAKDYRLKLLHLPCHQSLSENEMSWNISVVKKTLLRSANGVRE